MLQRCKPDPGGKVPSAPQGLNRWRKGRQGRCGHWSYAGNGHQPARRLVRLGPLGDLMVQTSDLLVQSPERLDQHLEDRSSEFWDWLVWIFDSQHELRDASRPFGRRDPELDQGPNRLLDDYGWEAEAYGLDIVIMPGALPETPNYRQLDTALLWIDYSGSATSA